VRDRRGVEEPVLGRAGQDALLVGGWTLRVGENVRVKRWRASDRNTLQSAVAFPTFERVVVTGDDGAGHRGMDVSGAVSGRRDRRPMLVCRMMPVTVPGYRMVKVMIMMVV
jgi:hypothetical protein